MTIDDLRRLARSRRTAYLASALLLAVSGMAGAAAFPFMAASPPVTATLVFAQERVDVPAGRLIQVYDLMPDGRTRRSGQASMDAAGVIQVARYDGRAEGPGGASAVLFPANVRTLWVLATEDERTELRQTARAFAQAAGRALDGAVNSPVFEAEYRPILSDILRRALAGAWKDPATEAAFAEVIAVADPLVRHVAVNDLRPALMERLKPAIWQAIETNAINILDVVSDLKLDLRPLESAFSGALFDPRFRNGAARLVPALAETPQTHRLAEALGVAFLKRLRDDPRLADTLGRLLSDGRFSAWLSPLGEPALTLARAVPRTLARLDEEADLNSLAADIFKTQARGYGAFVIIHLDRAAYERAMKVDPLTPVRLMAEAAR